MYSHKIIKKFGMSGVIYDDSKIMSMRDEYIRLLTESMRSQGYVIRYDIDPDFTVKYNGSTYDFELSVYGVYVGRTKAQCYKGIDKNKPIMM